MVSSGTLEGTDWKIDLRKPRLKRSGFGPAAFYKQLLSHTAWSFLIFLFLPFYYTYKTCVACDQWIDPRGALPVQVEWFFYLLLKGIRKNSGGGKTVLIVLCNKSLN